MKKLSKILLALLLSVGIVGCGGNKETTSTDQSKLVVSATLDPHTKILEAAKPILKEKYDIELTIKTLDDYYIFNKSLNSGDVDANYFQHVPFFDGEVKEKGYKITNAAGIHLEPFGFYSKTLKSKDDVKDGAKVIISNSVADHGRILAILEKAGLIEINDNVDILKSTVKDIKSNPKNLKFTEIKPELLGTAYKNGEGDLVAINGNYALQAGLNPTKDAIILESADKDNPYVNIVACQTGHENDKKIKALVEVLKSDEIKKFIEETYKGSVIPAV
ncbi:MAG: MetQ/NlpA family ABC transporter substrate-binding protein [Coprobacillus sp.]